MCFEHEFLILLDKTYFIHNTFNRYLKKYVRIIHIFLAT